MIPALKDLTTSRIVSAVGALVITSIIMLAIGLGFPAPAAAQDATQAAPARAALMKFAYVAPMPQPMP